MPPDVAAADIEKAQKALIALEGTDDAKRVLQPMTIKAFAVASGQDYLDLLKWVKQ